MLHLHKQQEKGKRGRRMAGAKKRGSSSWKGTRGMEWMIFALLLAVSYQVIEFDGGVRAIMMCVCCHDVGWERMNEVD